MMLVMVSALQTVISRVSWQTFVYSKKLPDQSKNIALFQSGRRII